MMMIDPMYRRRGERVFVVSVKINEAAAGALKLMNLG